MNMIATTAPTATVKDRMYLMTYLGMVSLAEALNGGTIGCAPLTKWKHGKPGEPVNPQNPDKRRIVHCFADWLIERYGVAAIAAILPQYEGRQRAQAEGPVKVVHPPVPKPTTRAINHPATPVTPDPVTAALIKTLEAAGWKPQGEAPAVDMEAIRAEIAKAIKEATLPKVTHINVTYTNAEGEPVTVNLGRQHKTFARLLERCKLRDKDGNRFNIWLSGPAGSGKTTAAQKVAEAFGLPYYFTGAVDTEYKLMGFIDAMGRVICPEFRKAWEFGGVFLLDECDGSAASALLAMNAALANGIAAFPDGMVKRHPDCIVIAAANTWGNGPTAEFIGRNPMDKASMDRFQSRMTWGYDWDMVRDTCGNPAWCDRVRHFVDRASRIPGHMITTRAVYAGAVMLAAGIPEAEVIEEVICPGLAPEHVRTMLA